VSTYYDDKYGDEGFFWGTETSSLARKVLEFRPPPASPKLLEIGCGEGRDTIFFARNGYRVTAFDASVEGVKKTLAWARNLGLTVEVFQADINEFRLEEPFDVIFSSGTLQYVRPELREEILANYRHHTVPGGIHAFMVPVFNPELPRDPEWDPAEMDWPSGKIMTFYHDWRIEFVEEQVLDDPSSGYQFAVNRIIAREPAG
jgi:tellurite methyltransferase